MKSKKVKPYVPSKRNALDLSEAQIEADRLAAEAWAAKNTVKKLPPDSAEYSIDASRLFRGSSMTIRSYRG